MHKKLGPLETWQWAAIGAAIGLLIYLYKRNSSPSRPSSSQAIDPATGVPYANETGSNAIDPTTGVPYAQELNQASPGAGGGSTGGVSDAGPIDPTTGIPFATELANAQNGTNGSAAGATPTLDQELSDLQSIETLMSGLQSVQPNTPQTPSAPTATGGLTSKQAKELANIGTLTKQVKKLQGEVNKLGKKKTTKSGGTKNPGHTVTTHPSGGASASSTAHNAGQRSHQKTVAKPSHQKAPALHPSRHRGP